MNLKDLKEIIVDGFYLTETERELFSTFKKAFNFKIVIRIVPVMLLLFYLYTQAICLAEYLRQLQG